MKLIAFFLVTILAGSCGTAKQSIRAKNDTLQAASIKAFGRSRLMAGNKLELISSAVHFSFSFSGTACDIYASLPAGLNHNYLQYELDGVYQKRLRVAAGNAPLHIAVPQGAHTITLYKATEAQTGALFIEKVVAKNIEPIKPIDRTLIEFIGNSITCGAAADASEIRCDSGEYHDHHNAYMAYGPRVARALHANFIMSSVSGIGIYRNWNSDGPTMPQVYEKTSLTADDKDAWTFEKYSPKVVSIALGTNDFSNGDGKRERLPFDSAVFVSRYIEFVSLVQTKYPAAQIALLSSPMLHDAARTLLQNCLTAVKNSVDKKAPQAKPLALFFFEPMQARGCMGHPSVEDHAVLAGALLPFFKSLMAK